MARPSEFTQDTADTICTRLCEGESLRRICRDQGMPSVSTVLRWASQRPEFAEQYRLASQAREAHWFEELREIADNSEGDYTEIDGRRVFNNENVQRSKLKIETIRWMLSKMSPRKFGDRSTTEIVGEGGGPVAIEVTQRKDPLWWQNALGAALAESGLKIVPLDAQIVIGSTNRDYELSPEQLTRLGLPAPTAGNGVSRA
jgi:Bacteriophage Sf6, terminase small subunit-like